MSGFCNYFLSIINPLTNIGFSKVLPDVMSTFQGVRLIFALTAIFLVPSFTIWIIYLLKPAAIRPPIPLKKGAEPLVSVVIAGRNESASIGQCIRSALQCGYDNLEVIFVDDHSDDGSVAIARRAVLELTGSRHDLDRVRIFPSPRRNGKVSSANIGIRMARGEFIAIVDADSTIEYGAIQHWLLPFANPRVGAVSANVQIAESGDNLLTRIQDVEYALKYGGKRLIRARVNLLNLIPGLGGIYRAEILRRLGGYDPGLGEDGDMSLKLLKLGWTLDFSLDAVVWTLVPKTWQGLSRQRRRWSRNTIKIVLSKHRDQFLLGRYGFRLAVISSITLFLVVAPWVWLALLVEALLGRGPLSVPVILLCSYWIGLIYLLIKALIVRDFSNAPELAHFWVLFLYPFYTLVLHIPTMYAEFCELFRIGAKHPYVPDHIWEEAPWW